MLVLIGVSLVLRLVLAGTTGLGVGEAYYAASARAPALSYFDQPPLSLWVIWATRALLGGSDLVLRLPFLAMFAGTTWLMYRLGARLFGPWAGFYAALMLNLSGVFTLSVAGWAQPDGPLMLLLLAAVDLLCPLVLGTALRPRTGRWLATGVVLGLALLAKYHAVLLVAGAFLFVATSRSARGWLARPGPYLAVAVAALLFLPVVVWNAQHDWVSFRFQGGRSLPTSGLHPGWVLEDLVGQAAWVFPWIWLGLVLAMLRVARPGPDRLAGWLLICLGLPPIATFTAISLWASSGGHFHWQAPGYLLLFPLLGRWLARALAHGSAAARWYRDGSIVLCLLGIGGLALQTATGIPGRLVPALIGAEDETVELVDWTELRQALGRAGLLDRPGTFAAATRWFEAGKVDAAIGDRLATLCLCQDPRNLAFVRDHRRYAGSDALLIGTDGGGLQALSRHFDAIKPLEPVTITRAGRPVLVLYLALGRHYHGDYPMPLTP